MKMKMKGELWIAPSIIGFAFANLFERVAMNNANPFVGASIECIPPLIVGVVSILFIGIWKGEIHGSLRRPKKELFLPFIASGLIAEVIGNSCFLGALKFGGVNIAVPIIQTQALFALVIAWIYLKEKIDYRMILGILIVLTGVILVIYGQSVGMPITPAWHYGALLALCSAICWSSAAVLWRSGQLRGASASSGLILHYLTGIVSIITILAITGNLDLYMQTSADEIGMLLIGGFLGGGIATSCFMIALRSMSVARAQTLRATYPVMACILASIFLDEYINLIMLIGILSTCIGVGFMQMYKTKEREV